MPIAAENHTLAAVVILLTIPPLSFRIMPAPRKPMPVTIPAAIAPGGVWQHCSRNKCEYCGSSYYERLRINASGLAS